MACEVYLHRLIIANILYWVAIRAENAILSCMFPHDIKIAASAIAVGISLVAYVPYLVDMFRGKNKPHLYNWISTVIITAIVAYIQLIGGAGVGSIPTMIGVVVDSIILFYCFRFGTKDIVFIDKVCLAATLVGVVIYIVFKHHPVLSLAVLTAAEIISFIPTYRKTRNDPYSESLPSYYLLMVKLCLILVALQTYNLLTVSYSVSWLAVFVIFLVSVFHWRTRIHRTPRKQELEEAPLV